MNKKDYYEVLGVPKDADDKTIVDFIRPIHKKLIKKLNNR